MPKRAAFLTDKQVRSLRAVGLYAVGGPVPGLALQVTETPGNAPARSWVLRAMVAGRRRALGLGPYPAVSLAAAREKAESLHRDIRENRDPLMLKCIRRFPRFLRLLAAPLAYSAAPGTVVPSLVRPNPLFKPSTNGVPRGPGRRYAVHFRQPGPRVTPLVPA